MDEIHKAALETKHTVLQYLIILTLPESSGYLNL